MKRRVIFSDNGSHSDFTNSLSDYYGQVETVSLVTSEDTIFIGTTLPLNHFYVKMGDTVNSESALMNIRHWDGTEWKDAVDVLDSTKTSGATLGQSGFVDFVPKKTNGWGMDDTVYDNGNEKITGLGTSIVYDRYWTAISFTNTLTSNVHLSWLGQKFSDDNDLGSKYPDLNRSAIRQIIDANKTSWEEQHVYVAGELVKDLIDKKLLGDPNQILCREDLKFASVHKVAETIYVLLGSDYADDAAKAEKKYYSALSKVNPKIDTNASGRLETQERYPTQGGLTR